MEPQPDHYIAGIGRNLPRGQIIGGLAPEEDEEDIDIRPEKILAEDRSTVVLYAPSAHRVLTSPEWRASVVVSASKPSDHDWTPPADAVSEILHSLPETATRVSICFERL